MNYQALFFDADGVVIRSPRLFSEQLEVDYGIRNEKLQPFFKGAFRQCSLGQADLKEELSKVMGEWGWKGTVDELVAYWFSVGTVFDQEVLDVVQELSLAGVRCYMTTDQERYRGEYLEKTIGSNHPFVRIFYSALFGMPKKDPQFYVKARNQASADHVLVIDDDEENLESAKAAGLDTHLYTSLQDLKRFFQTSP